MRRPLPLLFLLILSGLVLGCTIQTGLTRTSYDSFKAVDIKSFGIIMILPEKGERLAFQLLSKKYMTQKLKKEIQIARKWFYFFIHTGFRVS